MLALPQEQVQHVSRNPSWLTATVPVANGGSGRYRNLDPSRRFGLSLSKTQTPTYWWCSPPRVGKLSMRPALWTFLLQPQVRTDLIVVCLIAVEQVTKMLLAEDNDLIRGISADRTDEPFGVRAEIGRSRMPMAPRRRMKAPPYAPSRSRMIYYGVRSNGRLRLVEGILSSSPVEPTLAG